MGKNRVKTTLINSKLVFLPTGLVVIFLILAFLSRQEYLAVVYPEDHHLIQQRDYPYNGNYSDIAVIIDIAEVNPEASSITVSFYIRGWFTENYTNFLVWIRSLYSPNLPHKHLNITNRGGGPSGIFFYQIEDYDRGPYSHGVGGYAERFPYDYYIIRYEFTFWNIDPDLIFPLSFDPSIDVYSPSEWSVKSFIKGTGQGTNPIHRDIYLVLTRSSNRVSFYSSSFIFTFFEYLIIGSLVFIPLNKKNLSHRMMVLLTSSALVLTFYNTFTTRFLLETVSYVQTFFVSVIFSNMILLSFSILETFSSSKQIDDYKAFDLFGLFLTSILPLALFFSYVFFLLPPEYMSWWRYYLDYRFMLWLTLYVPIIWISLRRKSGYVFAVTGFLTLLFETFDMTIQNSDFYLLSFSVLTLFLGMTMLIQKPVENTLNFIKKLLVKQSRSKDS